VGSANDLKPESLMELRRTASLKWIKLFLKSLDCHTFCEEIDTALQSIR